MPKWDLLVIGGGAGGLGVALSGALRGYRVLLLEREDFAAGTSSRSTKLIHGGIRYLPQRRWGLLRESLRERRLLVDATSGWVESLPIAIPFRHQIEGWKYRVGLKLYEALAGTQGIGRSSHLSAGDLQKSFSWLGEHSFAGAWQYLDARFDDAGFALSIAEAIVAAGGTVINGVEVEHLIREEDRVRGARVIDRETGERHELTASVVVNATGAEVNRFRNPVARRVHRVVWSRGTHIVIEPHLLPTEVGLLLPETEDGRVLFVLPWYGHALVGTTEVWTNEPVHDPRPTREEVLFLMDHLKRQLGVTVERCNISAAFAGLRTLVGSEAHSGDGRGSTASLSRESVLERSEPGLISVLGGKWTTFRSQGERVIDVAEEDDDFRGAASPARTPVGEFSIGPRSESDPLTTGEVPSREDLIKFVRRAVRDQMARTVVDVLARRSRLLFVDVERACDLAPITIRIMAEEMGRDAGWIEAQSLLFAATLPQFEVPLQARD